MPALAPTSAYPPLTFLAADLGGTRARLLLGRIDAQGWHEIRRQELACQDFADLESLLAAFLHQGDTPQLACLALAGPVTSPRQARFTHLPWQVDAAQLERRLGLGQVHLLNDCAAQAWGLPCLGPADVHTLQAGSCADVPAAQNQAGKVRALLAAGTGLGIALLAGPATQPLVLASEGGHADFAPANAAELALLRRLQARHGRISLETVLSGPGLERLHAALHDIPAQAQGPRASQISAAALAGEAQAAATLHHFARLLLSAAGNLALTSLARGGVYLGGGLAPKILPFLQQPGVLAAFQQKPPQQALLQDIPLHVVLQEQLGLLGAAQLATRLAQAQLRQYPA